MLKRDGKFEEALKQAFDANLVGGFLKVLKAFFSW